MKRVADDAPVKVTRKQLRNGRLAPGTKVVTFCTAKDQPAQVVETPLGGTVKLRVRRRAGEGGGPGLAPEQARAPAGEQIGGLSGGASLDETPRAPTFPVLRNGQDIH